MTPPCKLARLSSLLSISKIVELGAMINPLHWFQRFFCCRFPKWILLVCWGIIFLFHFLWHDEAPRGFSNLSMLFLFFHGFLIREVLVVLPPTWLKARNRNVSKVLCVVVPTKTKVGSLRTSFLRIILYYSFKDGGAMPRQSVVTPPRRHVWKLVNNAATTSSLPIWRSITTRRVLSPTSGQSCFNLSKDPLDFLTVASHFLVQCGLFWVDLPFVGSM